MSLSSQTHEKAMSGCRVWRQAWIRHITPPPHTHTHAQVATEGMCVTALTACQCTLARLTERRWGAVESSWGTAWENLRCWSEMCAYVCLSAFSYTLPLQQGASKTRGHSDYQKSHMLVISTLTWTFSITYTVTPMQLVFGTFHKQGTSLNDLTIWFLLYKTTVNQTK